MSKATTRAPDRSVRRGRHWRGLWGKVESRKQTRRRPEAMADGTARQETEMGRGPPHPNPAPPAERGQRTTGRRTRGRRLLDC